MQKIVYMKIDKCVGWGDRIFALITNIMFAKINNAKFIINWCNDGIYGNSDIDTFSLYFSLKNIDWENNICDNYHKISNYDVQDWSLPVLLPDYTNSYFLEQMIHKYYGKFIPEDKISTYINDFIKTHINIHNLKSYVYPYIKDNNIQNIVGCHIRYSNPTFRKRYINELIKTVLATKRYLDNNSQLFLCCDGRDGYDYVYSILKDINIITYNKTEYFDNFDDILEQVHRKQQSKPNHILFGREALIEMLILSHCYKIFYSKHSSFGYLARCLKGVILL